MGTRYFTPKLFAFLRDLAENNDRDWFKAHQDDYEMYVREPALDFITDVADPLAEISPHFAADARKVGGSLFRIQRDIRFSKDKSPYKTNTGVQFRHLAGKDAHAPGFYLHIEPGGSFMGVGLWRPEAKLAQQIRQSIDEDAVAWMRATRAEEFTEVFSLSGDSLVRPPRGFDAEHPLIDDLKRKDFIASTRLTQRQITSGDFMDRFLDYSRRSADFSAFLCRAIGLPF